MDSTKRLHEGLQVVATIDPQTVANSEAVSDAIDMSKYRRVMAIFSLGDMAAETIDARLESDSASDFGTSKETAVAATQLAAHATNNDNNQIILELSGDDLTDGDQYVRGRMITGGGTGGPASCVILGEPRYSNEADLASVVEIKTA